MGEFTSEDDLSTFEGWLKYQGIDAATVTPGIELIINRNSAKRSVSRSTLLGGAAPRPLWEAGAGRCDDLILDLLRSGQM